MASADFVIVAGISLKVLVQTAYEEAPDLVGTWRRLPASNEAQSSERDPKRAFAMVVQFNPPSDFDALRAAISEMDAAGVSTPVPVSSPVDGLTRGVELMCWARLGRGQFHSIGSGTVKTTKMTAPLTLKQA